jgi:heterodisulfide reductase subunit C
VEFNDHYKPVSLEQIIEAAGARVVDYEEKDMCCGGSLNLTNSVDSMRIIQKKILNIAKTDANCIVVVCPYCYLQFEIGQLQLKKQNIHVSIPVLHLGEFIALALGLDIEKLLQMHKVPPNFPTNPYDTELMKEILEQVSLDLLKNCSRCRACSKDCSLVMSLDFDPLKFVDLIVEGRAQEAIQDPGIWKCLNCYGCLEKCPQRMGLAHFFIVLRNIAIKHGYIPESISKESSKFLEEGVVTGKRNAARKRLDLPVSNQGIEELKDLLKKNKELDVEI